jgi:hypothetical protein
MLGFVDGQLAWQKAPAMLLDESVSLPDRAKKGESLGCEFESKLSAWIPMS